MLYYFEIYNSLKIWIKNMNSNPMVHLCDHPLIQYATTVIRSKLNPPFIFRAAVKNLARYMIYEASKDLETKVWTVDTPLESHDGIRLACENIILAPILRAGLTMIDGAIEVFPNCQVRHIGLYRDEETMRPVEYYVKIPYDLPEDTTVFILDPMLATGGSAIAAIDIFKKRNVKDIRFLCVMAAPEGIEALTSAHSDVKVYTAAIDKYLNDKSYIVPGLGDAGDRAFGTV